MAGIARAGVEREAAWLHDVLEDTELTVKDLKRAGVRSETVDLVERVTRRDSERYKDYIVRVREAGPAAVALKLIDIRDHLARAGSLNPSLEKRYEQARATLEAAPRQGWAHRAITDAPYWTRTGRSEYPGHETKVGHVRTEGLVVAGNLRHGREPEETGWRARRLLSLALDVTEPRERQELEERVYAVHSHPRGDDHKPGDTYDEFPELEVKVVIDEVYPLPARETGRRGWTTSGLVLRLTGTGPGSSAAPRNYETGFYGTWRSEALTPEDAPQAWCEVLAQHGDNGHGTAGDHLLREALDSPGGAAYARSVLHRLGNARETLAEAVRESGRPRGSWT